MARETQLTIVGNLTADPNSASRSPARRSSTSPSPRPRAPSTGRPTSGRTGRPCSCVARMERIRREHLRIAPQGHARHRPGQPRAAPVRRPQRSAAHRRRTPRRRGRDPACRPALRCRAPSAWRPGPRGYQVNRGGARQGGSSYGASTRPAAPPQAAVLGLDVLVERAAERHVDQLQAPADAEDGLAHLGEGFHDGQVVQVAHAVADPFLRSGSSPALPGHVGAAVHDHASSHSA